MKGKYKMKRITIKELYASAEAYGEKEITVAGWIRTVRASNAFGYKAQRKYKPKCR